jgi:hypothetical protein
MILPGTSQTRSRAQAELALGHKLKYQSCKNETENNVYITADGRH